MLQDEKYFPYATGTKIKAIMKTTWGMSLKEIERVNPGKLNQSLNFSMFDFPKFNFHNQNRIKYYKSENINLWGYYPELTYDFFDDQLFSYTLVGDVYEKEKFDSLVQFIFFSKSCKPLNELVINFKKELSIKNDSMNNNFHNICWRDSTLIIYNNSNNTFSIEAFYYPIYQNIKYNSELEQESIF